MDKELNDPADIAGGLPKRRRRTTNEHQNVQVDVAVSKASGTTV